MRANLLRPRVVGGVSVLRVGCGEAAVRQLHRRCRRQWAPATTALASASKMQIQPIEGTAAPVVPTEAPDGVVTSSIVAPPASAFIGLGVDPILVAALPSLDVLRPSPIQAAALPAILAGHNCAVQSYTGSGKTLSYLLPVLTLALRRAAAAESDPATPRRGGVPDVPIQALIVAPSQELAMQIVRVARSLLQPLRSSRGSAAAAGGSGASAAAAAGGAARLVQQVIGGANPKRQAEALGSMPGPLVVVGTPGRLAEMVRSSTLRLHQCPLLVLDEADQLLASAFAEDINYLNDHCGKRFTTPKDKPSLDTSSDDTTAPSAAASAAAGTAAFRRQTVLVSATLTPSVLSRSAAWCPDPRFISAGAVPAVVAPEAPAGDSEEAEKPTWGWGVRGWDGPASPLAPKTHGSAGGVQGDDLIPTMPPRLQHYYLIAEPRHKVDTLRRAIHALGAQRALVFMNFQQRLQDAQFKLQARGMKAASLHGELPRLLRSNLLNDFRRGRLRALLVSDVAARGIDVPACDAVFHLELPSSAAHYAHRAGRTGRLSAALAAQAAEEAAAAAAAEAAEKETGQEEGEAQKEKRREKVLSYQEELAVEQAVGTVVTVVAPQERFVVEKLAEQLGVAVLEAHVSHGQFRLGPPPAGYSFERDHESDKAPEEEGAAAGGAGKARRERKRSGGDGERGAGEAEGASDSSRRGSGAEASTSGRLSRTAPDSADSAKSKTKAKTSTAPQQAKQPSKSSQTPPASPAAAAAAAARRDDSSSSSSNSNPPKGRKNKEDYEVVVDEDDDIVINGDQSDDDGSDFEDYEILDEDLAAFKSLRPSQVRQLGAAAAAAAAVGATAGAAAVKARTRVMAADGGGAAVAGIQLKAQRKRRVVLEDVVKPSSRGGAGSGGKSDGNRGAGASGKRGAGKAADARGEEGQRQQGGERPGALSRSAVLEELRRELEEIRAEKEVAKKQGSRRK